MDVKTAEIVLKSAVAGVVTKPIVNVFHYAANAAGSYQGQEQSIMQSFINGVYQTLTAALNASWHFGELSLRWLEDSTLPPVPWTGAAPRDGQVAGDNLPTNSAVYFLIRTSRRGRFYRGSKHYGTLSESDTTGNELAGAGLARWQALQTGAGSMVSTIVDGTATPYTPGVLSRKLSVLVNPTSVVFTPIAPGGAVLLDKTVGTMRRRRERTAR